MQFSGFPLLPVVREGYSTVRTIAGCFSGSLRHFSNIFCTHRSSVVTITPSKITRLPGNPLELPEMVKGDKKEKILIRESSIGVEHTRQIRRLHDFNPDILHVPDIGPVHLI